MKKLRFLGHNGENEGTISGTIGQFNITGHNELAIGATSKISISTETNEVDFQKVQQRNVVLHKGSVRPSNPEIGQYFYDEGLYIPLWWNGSYWKDALGNEWP